MTFLAPWALWAAGAVSAAVMALHILASKNPKVTALPTTRFIPDVPLRATARALRLSDVLLMSLRVAAVMLVGVAFARPELTGARRTVGRVVMVDNSRSANREAAGDSAHVYLKEGDALSIFDSAAYPPRAMKNRLTAVGGERSGSAYPRGSLSAGLAAAMRGANLLRGDADSVEIVLISPFANEEFDAATTAIRASWPGRMRIVRLAAMNEGRVQRFNVVAGSSLDDPLRATIPYATHLDTGRIHTDSVRIDRRSVIGADTTWTQYGLTLVRWPSSFDSSGYPKRARIDTAGAVMADAGTKRTVVVASFLRAVDPPVGRVVARWGDGAPAATERKMMNGCVRDVAIPLPRVGDLALRESMRRLVAALGAPCEFEGAQSYASDSALSQLAGTVPLVATRALESHTAPPGPLATWLLAAALALLLLEPLLRRQRAAA